MYGNLNKLAKLKKMRNSAGQKIPKLSEPTASVHTKKPNYVLSKVKSRRKFNKNSVWGYRRWTFYKKQD